MKLKRTRRKASCRGGKTEARNYQSKSCSCRSKTLGKIELNPKKVETEEVKKEPQPEVSSKVVEEKAVVETPVVEEKRLKINQLLNNKLKW